MEQVKLDAKHERAWEESMAALAWCLPGFTHVFHKMMHQANTKTVAVFTKDVPIAATDGDSLILNPENFFKFNLMERVFVKGHEIAHCIWNHCALMHDLHARGKVMYPDGTELPYIQAVMNQAMDGVINDMLLQSGKELNEPWGKLPRTIEVDGKPFTVCHYPNEQMKDLTITQNDSVIDAYRKLYEYYKQQCKGKGKGKPGPGDVGNQAGNQAEGFDQHLDPGTSTGQDPQDAKDARNETEWGAAVAAGMEAARLQGKLPASMERWFKEILNPQVDWKDHLRMEAKRLAKGCNSEWKKPDRRFIWRDIYAPSRAGYGCEIVVVGGDTSGSMTEADYAMVLPEVGGILEDVRPRKVIVIWCDAAVGRVDELETVEDLKNIKPIPGGGGTSFIPVFEAIEAMGITPDALIYFTDGHGSFPAQEPEYPVIWGSVDLKEDSYPFGKVVMIPKQAAKG